LTAGLLAALRGRSVLVWPAQRGVFAEQRSLLFALLLAAVGLGLTLVPELIYLRDDFRLAHESESSNCIYQAWLLLGVSGSLAVVMGLHRLFSAEGLARSWRALPGALLSGLALLLALASTIYLVAGCVQQERKGFRGSPPLRQSPPPIWRPWPQQSVGLLEWVRANTLPDDMIVEGEGGASSGSETNRISTMTGRPLPSGWDGHQSRWRGAGLLARWLLDGQKRCKRSLRRKFSRGVQHRAPRRYRVQASLYVGPAERAQSGLTPSVERSLFDQFERVYPEDPAGGRRCSVPVRVR
jgi:uncharacterized membrane protein